MASPVKDSAKASSDAVIQTLKWVRKQGFKPVPLHKQSKASIDDKFVAPDYSPPSDDLWLHRELGIGVVTGPKQSGPLDVDIDCQEAAFFAAKFLPATPAVFGRKSKLRSHYLYRVEVDEFPKRALVDPLARSTVIELRGDGGHQTVFPGSVHEGTGEVIEWSDIAFPDVPRVDAAALDFAVKKVAVAVVIARHMWAEGQRNEVCKHVAGMLYYLDWPEEEVKSLVSAVMEFTDDKDKTRLRTVAHTFKKGEKGGKVTGSNTLRTFLGDGRLVDRILEWAGNDASSLLQDYNERFAVVTIKGKFRIAETLDIAKGEPPMLYAKDDFLNLMQTDTLMIDGKKVQKGKLWLGNPRRRAYRTMDFIPGVEDTSPVLNLWTGWAVEPSNEGSCRMWLDLLFYTICGQDQEAYEWMLHWFANILREPRNKSLTCPVMIGIQGAGKSLLINYFGRILGPAYVVITNEEHIYGRFNKHLATTLLLHSEEALYGGEKKHRGIIKSLITDELRMSEQKGIDAEKVQNHLRLILTSNESHAAPAEAGDRRFTVMDLSDRKASNELVKGVLEEMEGGGPAALFHHLAKEMDYDRTKPRTNLKNEALATMKQINLDPLASWWHDCLRSGLMLPDFLGWASKPEAHEWPQVVSSKALYIAMVLKMRERGSRYIPDETSFCIQLNKMLKVKLDRAQRYYNNPLSDDAPREVKQLQTKQYTILNMPSLDQCRKSFDEFLGQELKWPKEEDVEKPIYTKF